MKSQKQAVIKHLNKGLSLTSGMAFTQFGITRLSAIIFDLRREGYPIETHMYRAMNRYGNVGRFAAYRLPSGSKR